jgi:hypothetical protein
MVQDHLKRVAAGIRGGREIRGTNVDWVYITVVIRVHVAIGEEAVGEEGE